MRKLRSIVPSWQRWVVLYRDCFTCQECGKKGRYCEVFRHGKYNLAVHHIHDAINNDYYNLITLCPGCHFKIHDNNWKKPPNKKFTPKPISEQTISLARLDWEWRGEYRSLPTIETVLEEDLL